MCLLGLHRMLLNPVMWTTRWEPDTSLVDRTGGGQALDSLQNIIILFISAGTPITHLNSLYLMEKPC